MCRSPKGHLHMHLLEILEPWQIQCYEMEETFTKDLEELTEMNNTLEGINSRISEAKEWIRVEFFFSVVDLRSEENFIQTHTHTYIYTHTYTYSVCVFSFSCWSIVLLQHKYFCHEFNKCNSSENKITAPGILDTEAHEWLLTEE